MKAEVVASTKDMDRETWLKARRTGLGGSDVSAILGMNKWKSPIAVYLDKIGQAPEEELSSEAAYWGTKQESLVAEEFSLRTGLKIRKRNAILRHPKYPWMLANVDRLIVGQDEGLECKTASEYLKNEWKDDQVPSAYLLQCQHYMSVCDFNAWWIAVLIGGNKFQYKRIERDEEIISLLIEKERDFWENHVLKQIPPEFDGSDVSTELLTKMYPESKPDSEIDLSSEADNLIDGLLLAKEDEKRATEIVKEYENKLKGMIGEYETGRTNSHLVTWKNFTSNRIDSKALSKDYPDIYQKYTKPSTSRRFGIKTLEG